MLAPNMTVNVADLKGFEEGTKIAVFGAALSNDNGEDTRVPRPGTFDGEEIK